MLIRVAFEFQLDKSYDYAVPDDLQEAVKVGMRVEAPLGNSVRNGYVLQLNPPETNGISYKSINKILETEAVITPPLMELAQFISRYYFCSQGVALRCFLPAAVRKRTAAASLVHVVRPAKGFSEIMEHTKKISKRAPRQASVLRCLTEFYAEQKTEDKRLKAEDRECVTEIEHVEIPDHVFRLSELSSRADAKVQVIRTLEKKGWLTISLEKYRNPREHSFVPSGSPELNSEQLDAVNSINKSLGSFQTFLLYGVTGSGKTEVYLQVIKKALDEGKGAIILVPEIALTPQTVERFSSRFGEEVAVLHSSLTDLDRFKQWWSIKNGHAKIVVGARSAIFAPVKNLGVIVVDEEHERTYKQSEEIPRYNARDIAVMRGRLENTPVILGSATPSLESIYNVTKKKYKLLQLPVRVVAKAMPKIQLVDLAKEAKVAPQLGVISRPLRDALQNCLDNGEQALLFLNRRGYCPIIVCPSCNYIKRCENCSVSITYHAVKEKLSCHLCGHEEPYRPPYYCPDCKKKLNITGFGTQRVEKNLACLFPKARIGRMDRDTTSKRGSHERILSAFSTGEIDFLLGTQMIAKGLDFPNVTVVGVINADISLHVPDFRATETTFQLITQVAGRSGRAEKPGKVIVQSFTPEHPAVTCAVNGQWRDFAREELKLRRELCYPPYTHIINIIFKGKKEKEVVVAADDFGNRLKTVFKKFAKQGICSGILGPAPAPLSLAYGYYRWQLILKVYSVGETLKKIIAPTLKSNRYKGVQIIVDVDPI